MIVDDKRSHSGYEVMEKIVSIEQKHQKTQKGVEEIRLIWVLHISERSKPPYITLYSVQHSFEPVLLNSKFVS